MEVVSLVDPAIFSTPALSPSKLKLQLEKTLLLEYYLSLDRMVTTLSLFDYLHWTSSWLLNFAKPGASAACVFLRSSSLSLAHPASIMPRFWPCFFHLTMNLPCRLEPKMTYSNSPLHDLTTSTPQAFEPNIKAIHNISSNSCWIHTQ